MKCEKISLRDAAFFSVHARAEDLPCGMGGGMLLPGLGDIHQYGHEVQERATLDGMLCQRLAPGQSATVNFEAAFSPTRVQHAYRLHRTGEGAYRSEVRLALRSREGESIPAESLQRLRERIGRCLREQSDLLRGPAGETLTIQLSDDPAVPAASIQVTATDARADAELDPLQINCPSIVHEILHLHGLVDEYREETMGVKVDPGTGRVEYLEGQGGERAFDCRHEGLPHSIMANPWRALVEARNWDQWEYAVCVAGEGARGRCEAGHTEKLRVSNIREGEEFGRPALPNRETLVNGSPRRTGREPRLRESALTPAQFLSITRPGCLSDNQRYYQCSANAYVTRALATRQTTPTTDAPSGAFVGGLGGGLGFPGYPPSAIWRHGNESCQPTPPECKDPELWSAGPRSAVR